LCGTASASSSAEAVVDPLELERFVQVTRSFEEKLCFLGPPVTTHFSFIMPE
jgi:hypothetical protein